MTPEARRALWLAVFGVLYVCAQCSWASHMSLRGGKPDFILVYALIFAQFSPLASAASVGFAAGLLTASLAGPVASGGPIARSIAVTASGGFGSFIVSRTIACSVVGWLEERVYREHILSSVAIAFAGTLGAECLFFIFDPQRHATVWVRHLAYETVLNTLLSVPTYLLIYMAYNPGKLFRKRQLL